jgi:hypothetical protein
MKDDDERIKSFLDIGRDDAVNHPPGKWTNHRMRLLMEAALNQISNNLNREGYEVLQVHAGCDKPSLINKGSVDETRLIFKIKSDTDEAEFVLGWKRLEPKV